VREFKGKFILHFILTLNTHSHLFRFSAALQEAAQVDKLIEEETGGEDVLEDRLPLLGVPITVKEAFALQGILYNFSFQNGILYVCRVTLSVLFLTGMPNSTGLLSRRDLVSGADAPSVALLKRAGAIPLGVTNCSELCMWLESHNHLYGITNNPYDFERIAGGSSGHFYTHPDTLTIVKLTEKSNMRSITLNS